MFAFPRFVLSLLTFMVVYGLCFSPSVRLEYDDHTFIRLPSDNDNLVVVAGDGDVCFRMENRSAMRWLEQ
ncbi:hypothetical protein U1Q18_021381 [Sarracenia purpurea var. burkii]